MELLLHVCAVGYEELRVHVHSQLLHHLKRVDTRFGINHRHAVVTVEGAAKAEEHVVEILREVPAGLHGGTQWVVHNACIFDRLGCGEHIVVGCGGFQPKIGKDVRAVHHVLRVHHHGDGHDLTINADQLVGAEVLPVFGNQIIQRTNRALVQQRRNGPV